MFVTDHVDDKFELLFNDITVATLADKTLGVPVRPKSIQALKSPLNPLKLV